MVDASGQDDVLVGRIRRDLSDPSDHSISIFVAADQLSKGAALNAIQIAEQLLPTSGAPMTAGQPTFRSRRQLPREADLF